MPDYVVIALFNEANILVAHKDRPDWQKGRLNLPGGKIEPGESSEIAAHRELKEETGLESNLEVMGYIVDGSSIIYCYRGFSKADPMPQPGETERMEWLSLESIRSDPRLIPNLRVIIPMMYCGMNDWVVMDSFRAGDSKRHSFQVVVPTYALAQS